ncbi:phospholipid scramblase 1 [Schaereria dolodes]|nr:phospholipid scramblase 1 [Schaereria dolodes]
MTIDKILLTFLGLDALFAATGGALLAAVFILKNGMAEASNTTNVATNLLLLGTPLTGGIILAGLVFLAFLVSLAGVTISTSRSVLKLHTWLVIACAIMTLILGLDVWFSTLKTKSHLGVLWSQQTTSMQSLLQQKFNCCGYLSSTSPPFQQDNTCANPIVAASKSPCVGPFSNFANSFLDVMFTAMFGFVALDVMLFLSGVVVLKDRKEKERYRLIDAKNGFGGI